MWQKVSKAFTYVPLHTTIWFSLVIFIVSFIVWQYAGAYRSWDTPIITNLVTIEWFIYLIMQLFIFFLNYILILRRWSIYIFFLLTKKKKTKKNSKINSWYYFFKFFFSPLLCLVRVVRKSQPETSTVNIFVFLLRKCKLMRCVMQSGKKCICDECIERSVRKVWGIMRNMMFFFSIHSFYKAVRNLIHIVLCRFWYNLQRPINNR